MNAVVGSWGDVIDTTIIGIHQVVMADGRVLYWGGDGNGNAFSNTQKYGIFDPATGEHEILSASHVVRMFCGAGVIIPGTDKVLISGGNGSGDRGGQLFDLSDETLTNNVDNFLNDGRFYPTTVTLSTGQVVILGGRDAATPEIFTLGEGWRNLDGATDADVGASWWYPKAWVSQTGEILYIAINAGNQLGNPGPAGSFEVMALDPSGDGSIRQVGEVPFQLDATSPAAMYDVGKIVIMDHVGDLWIMDINGETPTFTFAADLDRDRNNSDMTVLPDGRVLINGGTSEGNSEDPDDVVYQSVIFDPFTSTVTYVDSEDVMRLYHSSSVLLADGTILSMGGGGLGNDTDLMDAQVYSPDYLFNTDGTLADRPVVVAAPDELNPGATFNISVDDTSDIARLSFVKTGAVTHSINLESGRMDLDFQVLSATELQVTLPESAHIVGAGNWMLFAIDDQGVPSVAPIISVLPTLTQHDGVGDLTAEYFSINPGTTSLSQVSFDGASIFTEQVATLDEGGNGAFYPGGPADNFAVRYTGSFMVEATGAYTYYLTSDDGAQLFIDGTEVINNDGVHAAQESSATVQLDRGSHTIEVRYFEAGGGTRLDLDWSGPGFGRKQATFDGGESTIPPGNVVQDQPNVVQSETGSTDNDVFAIAGLSADYGWGDTEDGTGTVVWGDTGYDLLFGFETIRFADQDVSIVRQTGTEFLDQPGTQTITGTDAVETFVINASSEDYGWGATNDGTGTVVWNDAGYDLLFNIESITFVDRTVELVTGDGPQEVLDDPQLTQYVRGTDGTDRFVINGQSGDYQWGPTEDGMDHVVWNDTSFDVLYDFEQLVFNDTTIQLDQIA